MEQIDIDKFRLGQADYSVPPITSKTVRRHGPGEWFIASMPGPWIAEAAKLPGHALHVAIAIMWVCGMERSKEVALTRYHFDHFSTKRGSTLRGMNALQQAGLIEYTKDGHKFRVKVLPR